MNQRTYRFSGTQPDAFRAWKAGRFGDDEMIARLERRSTYDSPEMRAGRAFHAMMERHSTQYTLELPFTQDGITFVQRDEDVVLPRLQIERGDRAEIKVVRNGLHPRVQLSGVLDVLTGTGEIRDYKTSPRLGGIDKYESSLQWRIYAMLVPDAHMFTYIQVVAQRVDDDTYALSQGYQLRTYRYPGMKHDVCCVLDEMVAAADAWVDEGRLDYSRCKARA